MSEPLLSARHLAKSLGQSSRLTQIIGDISFEAQPGQFVSLVGPSGCGKTTLLMVLAGLYQADRGEVRFEGQRIDGPTAGVSVVFQDYSRSLLPWKSVRDNVMFGMHRQRDWNDARKRDQAARVLAAVGLERFADYYPWQVSGGMQQRVAIARALAAQSRLLLLDEPLAAVDAQTRADMQDLILELAHSFDQTCLLVTHDVDEAVYMADRVLVLSPRPTRVTADITVELGPSRDQIDTREQPAYLQIRHQVLGLIRAMRHQADPPPQGIPS